MINFYTVVISAIFGALIAIFTNWWRTRYTIREQDFSKRIEEIIKKIESIEDVSCKYWAGVDLIDRADVVVNLILGKTTQLELLISFIISEYENINEKIINDALADFTDTVTGNEFGSKGELFSPQPMKIQTIFFHAEKLKLALHKERVKNY